MTDPRMAAAAVLALLAGCIFWLHATTVPPTAATTRQLHTKTAVTTPTRPPPTTLETRQPPMQPRSRCKEYRDLKRPVKARAPSYQFLFTGCGYSGTGLSSHVMRALGYCVGHERLGTQGAASWIWAFPGTYHGQSSDPAWYRWVVVQHRDPLKVVNSGLNTGFHPLNASGQHSTYAEITRPRILERWPELESCVGVELALLAWWETWTHQGLSIPGAIPFSLRGLDYAGLLNRMGFNVTERAVRNALSGIYNRHTTRDYNVTWDALAAAAGQCKEGRGLVSRSLKLAKRLGY